MNSLQTDFEAALGDEEFDDLLLISSDRMEVPANRLILSLRSKVFRDTLMLDNRQAIAGATVVTTVKIDYPGVVLKSLVYFCYTDQVKEGQRDGANFRQEESMALVGLMNAAGHFGMKELKRRVFPLLSKLMARHPFAATLVVCNVNDGSDDSDWEEDGDGDTNENGNGDGNETSLLIELAQRVIAVRPASLLTLETLSSTHPSHISKLINGLIVEGHEELCCTLLEEWTAGDDDRLHAAQEVVSSLQLHRLDPRVLGNFVDRGTVVTPGAASDAFRQQAEAWAEGVPFSARDIDERTRDVVVVHGCGNPDVNGVYVYKPAGAVSLYVKQKEGTTDNMSNAGGGEEKEDTTMDKRHQKKKQKQKKNNVFTLEEDETDKTWYLKRGESDLLFKAPFERLHDFTKVPFDTWRAEDEEEHCTPPLILFVPIASA
jgi:hypothetical protein